MDRWAHNLTLEQVPTPGLSSLNTVSEEVVPLPEIRIGNRVGNQLLHCRSQLGVLGEISSDVLRLLIDIKLLGPGLILGASAILDEVVRGGVDDVKLRIEPRGVDHPLPSGILALEQNGVALVVSLVVGGWCDLDGVAEEVAEVGTEPEESFVGGVFGFLEIL